MGKICPRWIKMKTHDDVVRKILIDEKCMDSKGHILQWTTKAYDKIVKAGHTSLDFDRCSCGRE